MREMRQEACHRRRPPLQGVAAAEFFDGALCTRCEIDLGGDGLCPNDRCPFNGSYQDESNGDWELPDDEERDYIERVVKRRRGK